MNASLPQTIPQAIARHAHVQPEKEALRFLAGDGRTQFVSFGRLDADARGVGQCLLAQGIRPGELAVLAFAHGYPLVTAFLGAMYAGVVPSIFPDVSSVSVPGVYCKRVRRLVRQVRPRALVTQSDVAAIRFNPPQDIDCPVVTIRPDDLGRCKQDRCRIHPARPEEPAYIQFSSGSTGTPRGVVIPHRAALNQIIALSQATDFGPAGISVGWTPFFHDMGLVGQLLMPLVIGGRSVHMAPRAWLLRPVKLMHAIHRNRGTLAMMPNFGFQYCAHHIRDVDMAGIDLGSLKTLVCGGEPIQIGALRKFVERFEPFGLRSSALMPGYGLAENTLGATIISVDEEARADRISRYAMQTEGRAQPVADSDAYGVDVVNCGEPFLGTEISIGNERGEFLPERHIGEIRIRGNSLFAGYYRQPEATARALRNGWFHTGDMGYLADGRLYVVDRKKDLIITAGQNIYPHHVEEAAWAVAGKRAKRMAAFGVPDERLGTELPVVVVEVRGRTEAAGHARLADAIRRQVLTDVGIRLADVRLVRTGWIEITTSGKLARRATLQKYLAAGWHPPFMDCVYGGVKTAGTRADLETALARIVAAVTGMPEVSPHSHLAELGIDSMALVQVLLLIEEELGHQVPVEQFALNPTIHGLACLLNGEAVDDDPRNSPPMEKVPLYPPSARIRRRQSWHDRLLRREPTLLGWALPYRLGTRLLAAVARQPSLRQRVYPRQMALLRRCLAHVPVKASAEAVIRQSLMVNSWPNWRRLALERDGAFEQWVTVRGEDVFLRQLADGRGIVLAFPHTELKKLLRRLPLLKGRELALIGNVGAATLAEEKMPHLADAVANGAALSKTAVRSAQLIHALRVLRAGGVVIVATDDDDGVGGIHVSFHGRGRPFRPGAAELSIRSGAPFVPVFAAMDPMGRITFEFLNPLLPEGADHARRVKSLLRQYASLLAVRYTTHLGAMEWYILRKFLHYPEVHDEHRDHPLLRPGSKSGPGRIAGACLASERR